MRSKQLKRQLFLAVLMLIVSFMALSSATYAWFSMNSTVEAKGISMNAQTEGLTFEIAKVDAAGTGPVWVDGQTTTNYELNAALYPVHPEITEKTPLSDPATWYHSFSDTFADADSKVISKLTPLTSAVFDRTTHLLTADEKDYALLATYYVRINPKGTAANTVIRDLKIRDVVITGSSNLIDSVSLLITTAQATTVIKDGATSSDIVLVDEIATTDSEEGFQIDVYAYYDGQHEDCKSSLYDTEDIAISFVFAGESGTNP